MKVLVTGATGFIGGCLVRKLIEIGHDVNIIIRENSNVWRIKDIVKHMQVYYVDLTDAETLEKLIAGIKPEIIYHLAAYAAYPLQNDTVTTVNTNILGTINLVNICAKYGFKSFINTGSSSEYGKKTSPMKETDLLEPNSLYGITKSASTLYCEYVGKSQKLPIATLRLFSVYGYYEEKSRLIPSVVMACITGQNLKLSSRLPVRDFIFIEDVLDLYLKLSETDNLNGIILNAGTGVQHSVSEVVNICIELTGASIKPEWGAVQGRTWDTDIWVADNSKIKNFLKWEPEYDLRRGLNKTIEWFKNNIHLYN